jgi:myo-inositol 2-dehydrogenase/D-chiro-inositol 1-dehydrogenase
MKDKICIGIIGAGRIGKLHTENVINNMHDVYVKWISDIYIDKMADWCSQIGVKNITTDYMDVLEDAEVDAVLICSSTDTHAKISIQAAQHKKHIFCEKPIDLDVEKIKEVESAVNSAGVKMQVGFNRRYDHNFKRAQERVAAGDIGDVHLVKITSRDPAPPPIEYVKVSGGLFLDMAIHDFDMARFLSGSEVTEITAKGAVLIDENIGREGDVDTAVITLLFENGAMGIIDNSRQAVYGYDQRIEVFGSKGCITAENDFPNTTKLVNIDGVHGDKPKYFFLDRYFESYTGEVKAFIECIKNDTEPEVGIKDGLNSVVIGLAAKKSLASNSSVKL